MSLLEDVFLEDEAGEAQELERVIEGDELDERPRTPDSDEDSEKEGEAEEDKRVVDHSAKAKRVVKNPRFILNPARLTGPRGIQIIPEHFKDFQFRGKGHEREDLDSVLKKLEHWAYRLYPKFKFDDCLKKIETLGKKRPVMVHLHKIRTDQFVSEEIVQQQESSGDEAEKAPPEEDEFDRLLQQQIELARATPAPGSVTKEMHTPLSTHRSPLMVPKAASSPSISDEQKERMIRNRRLAEERRLARLNQVSNNHNATADTHNASNNTTVDTHNTSHNTTDEMHNAHNGSSTELVPESTEANSERVVHDVEVNDDVDNDIPVIRKQNRTNVIDSDSSADEGDVLAVNESITVQVHTSVHEAEDDSDKENTALDAMVVESDGNVISTDVPVDINKSIENIQESVIEKTKESDIIETILTNDKTSEDSNTEVPKETNISETSLRNNKTSEDSNTEDTETETNLEEDKTSEHSKTNTETNSTVMVSNDTDKKRGVILSTVVDKSKEVVENKETETGTEELMDVDFSDDF